MAHLWSTASPIERQICCVNTCLVLFIATSKRARCSAAGKTKEIEVLLCVGAVLIFLDGARAKSRSRGRREDQGNGHRGLKKFNAESEQEDRSIIDGRAAPAPFFSGFLTLALAHAVGACS